MKSWPTKRLSDAYWFQEGPGVRKWQFRNSGIKLLNVANITKEGTLDLSRSDRHLSEDEVIEKYSHFMLDEGDLVIASSGISFDEDGLLRTRGAFVESQHLPLSLNTSTIRFKPKEGFSTLAWLRYWLNSIEFRAQITRLVTGSAQQNFGPSHLKATKISLPPLAEQERLVKLLDEADELRKLRAQADRRSTALIPALFHEMFGDPFKKTTRWPNRPLGEIVNLGSGATPSKENPEFWNGRTPWVSPKDMKEQEITDTEDHVSGSAFEKTNLELIPGDTVLIVVRGMILAHTVPIRLCRVSVTINQDMKALLPKQPIEAEFLRWSLQAQHAHLLNQVSTASHGTKKLDSESLRAVTIPIPPLPLQKEFAQRVAEIRGLEAEQTASRRRLEDLFQSLLHRAFEGEL